MVPPPGDELIPQVEAWTFTRKESNKVKDTDFIAFIYTGGWIQLRVDV
jgi:hypothetical protein